MKEVSLQNPKLAAKEWDFRAIPESALRVAALYEYARSTTELKARIRKWFNCELDGETIRRHLQLAAASRKANREKGTPFRHSRRAKVLAGGMDIAAVVGLPGRLGEQIQEEARRASIPKELIGILARRYDFPRAWLDRPLRIAENPGAVALVIKPISTLKARIDLRPEHWEEIADSKSDFLLHIDGSSAKKTTLIKEFGKWLDKWMKGSGQQWRKGTSLKPPHELLRRLAVLRLKRAGFHFVDACKLWESWPTKEKKACHPSSSIKEPNMWDRDITHALSGIEKLESGIVPCGLF